MSEGVPHFDAPATTPYDVSLLSQELLILDAKALKKDLEEIMQNNENNKLNNTIREIWLFIYGYFKQNPDKRVVKISVNKDMSSRIILFFENKGYFVEPCYGEYEKGNLIIKIFIPT